jgi:GNAT superfamily N-acetyltransferase
MADPRDDGLEVRDVTPDDIDAMLELIRICLGPGSVPRSREYLLWKHFNGPFGPSLGLVAIARGEIVGLRLFLRWRFVREGTTHEAVRPVDTAVHPRWRRRGIFTRLTTALVEKVRDSGCSFVFNTPNANSRRGYLRMGWQDLGRAPLMVRICRPRRVLAAGLGRISGLWPHTSNHGLAPVGDLLEDPMAGALSDASEATSPRFVTARDRAYLRWRYHDIPGIDYCAEWEGSGGAHAAVVFRTRERRGLRELSIAELLVGDDQSNAAVAAGLLKKIVTATDPDLGVACAAAGTAERGCLLRAGFLPIRVFAPRIVIRRLRDIPGVDITARDSWQLSLGDLEVF